MSRVLTPVMIACVLPQKSYGAQGCRPQDGYVQTEVVATSVHDGAPRVGSTSSGTRGEGEGAGSDTCKGPGRGAGSGETEGGSSKRIMSSAKAIVRRPSRHRASWRRKRSREKMGDRFGNDKSVIVLEVMMMMMYLFKEFSKES